MALAIFISVCEGSSLACHGVSQGKRKEMPVQRFPSPFTQHIEAPTEDELLRRMVAAYASLREPYYRVFRNERPKCGAKCRNGNPCKAPASLDPMYECYVFNGRCRMHGGLSTGPRTQAGKARIAAAARLKWQRYREAQLLSAPTGSS